MKATEKIADFLVNTRFKDISKAAIEASKRAFLDTLGVTIAGSTELTGKVITEFVKDTGANPEAGVICGGFRTASFLAAMANGTMAHALDYDDSAGTEMPLHPSAPVMPVALAIGEEVKASGKEVLQGYIFGVEIEAKLASAMSVNHYARGWHPTAVIGTLGAAAAAARLLRLNVEETVAALGIACSLAGGLRQNFGTMTKPLHAGNAARNGVVAARLAKKGWSADSSILEAPSGFVQLFAGEGELSLEQAISSLGNPFHFEHPGVPIKRYPSCLGTYAPIEALKGVMQEHVIPVEEVASLECGCPALGIESLIRPDIKTGYEGKFGIEHCLAVLLLDKEVGLSQFSEERAHDPEVAKLRRKVRVYADPELWDGKEKLDYFAAIATVKLRNGTQYSHTFKKRKSELASPLPWGELTAKFTSCARLALSQNKIEGLMACVEDLENLDGIGKLMDLALG